MNRNIIFFITIIISFLSTEITGQVHTVFLDDTTFFTKRFPEDKWRVDVTFKDSLEDGTWILHNLYRKDSINASDKTILLVGSFNERRKDGVFNYYSDKFASNKGNNKDKIFKYPKDIFSSDRNEKTLPYYTLYLAYSEVYKSGLLDGLSMSKNSNGFSIVETMYKNGKKHGLRIIYHDYAQIAVCIDYYDNDTLKYWQEYLPLEGKYSLYGIGKRIKEGNYIYTSYYPDGQQNYIAYYSKFELHKYQKFYINQNIEKEAEGVFKNAPLMDKQLNKHEKISTYDYYSFSFNFSNFELIKGTEKMYSPYGELLYEKKIE